MNHSRFGLYSAFIFGLLWNTTINAIPHTSRDPTQPAVPDVVSNDEKKDKKEKQHELKGVFISPHQRVALIDETFVKEGDKFEMDYVEKINKNSIVLSRPGQKRTIYLFELKNLE